MNTEFRSMWSEVDVICLKMLSHMRLEASTDVRIHYRVVWIQNCVETVQIIGVSEELAAPYYFVRNDGNFYNLDTVRCTDYSTKNYTRKISFGPRRKQSPKSVSITGLRGNIRRGSLHHNCRYSTRLVIRKAID